MKTKKILLLGLSLVLCVFMFFSIKANASNPNYEYGLTLNSSRNTMYVFIVRGNAYNEASTATILKTNYTVMGNTQTPKNTIKLDGSGHITFNFLNGDTQTLDYNQNYVYYYGVDIGNNQEFYGVSQYYDFENNTPILNTMNHNATYTQYELIDFTIYVFGLIHYGYIASDNNTTITTFNNFVNSMYQTEIIGGYINNNAQEYAHDKEQNAYTNGYYTGLQDGEEGKSPLTRVWEIIGGVFNAVANVMSIELFPSIPVGIFFLVPLVFGAVGFIFWIWKRGG